MPSIQKTFLKRVTEVWRIDFPFLKRVDLTEVPSVPKGSNFICDEYFRKRDRAYFIRFDFSQKRVGEFTIGITVSDSLTRSIREHGLESPSSSALGMFSIGQFLPVQSRTWALRDINAEVDQLFQSLGQEPVGFGKIRSTLTWYPSSFDLPQKEIVDAAIADVGATLKKHVFPKLEIAD